MKRALLSWRHMTGSSACVWQMTPVQPQGYLEFLEEETNAVMSLYKTLLLACAVAFTGVPCLASDKIDSAHPPAITPRGTPMQTHQDFGYPASPTSRLAQGTSAGPRQDQRLVPTVDYYRPYGYYPRYNAPYHVPGYVFPYPEPRFHSPYPYESQGGVFDYGYYPGHLNYTVGPRNCGSFYRTYTDSPNYP